MLVDGRPEPIDALLAFVVAAALAWLLVPAAEWIARRVGAIDYPNERSLHAVADAEAGRPGDPRRRSCRRAALPALGPGLAATRPARSSRRPCDRGLVGVIDDIFDLHAAPQAARTDRRGDPRLQRRARSRPSRCRSSAASILRRSTWSARRSTSARSLTLSTRDRRDGEHHQPDRRGRRPCRRRLRDLRRHAGGDGVLLDRNERRGSRRPHRGRSARVPAPRLPAGVELHGRYRLEPARLPARVYRDPGRAEDERRGRPVPSPWWSSPCRSSTPAS